MMMKEEEEEEIFYSPEKMEERNGAVHTVDEEEDKRLAHMRSIVENQDPTCKDTDDLTLRRFLRARDLDVEKASAMFMKYFKWRRKFVPKGFISTSEVTNQLQPKKVCLQGTDKRGCPVSVLFGARHFPCKGGMDELNRFIVFVLDKLCSRIPDGHEKLTIIADLQGYGYSNSDFRGYLAIFTIYRLGKLLIIHAPYIFMTLWKIIHPFIDENTRKKIIFVENKKLQATLLEEIDESQLPEIYGGKLQLVPIQDA
ncbi:UNVERIFIED_CONTAM: CRAL-TRIO domain-containing protein [Sesamum angustifolium]|uniref:CRAL-TRIO domain-containing protein n=1 Tax=Sesamum angustifolium TaxID=2727405 RepID=A0AAW2RKC8_9LAMI